MVLFDLDMIPNYINFSARLCKILGNRDIKKINNTVYECFSIEKGTCTSLEAGNYEIPALKQWTKDLDGLPTFTYEAWFTLVARIGCM